MTEHKLKTGNEGGSAPLRPYRRQFLMAAGALVLAAAVLPYPVSAQSLDSLRASGAVGERFDGYAEARSNDATARSVVRQVNGERRKIYQRRAAEQGVAVEQVGRVYAEQIFRRAPSGTYFLQENGQWTQK